MSEHTIEHTEAHDDHDHGDVTVFRGKTYNIPIYTSVFISLGVLTILEVVSSEIFPESLSTPILLSLAFVKAFLVIYFYMHLKSDSRVFAIALAVPIVIAMLSALFLFSLPTQYGF